MNKKLFSAGGLVLVLVLLLTLNVFSSIAFKGCRIDLTDNKLYTLSQGTKNILQNLEEPVTLRYFFSEKLAIGAPGVVNYSRRVRDILEEFASHSKGKIRLIVADPEPFSDEEDQAVQYGLQGVPIDTAGSLIYFGLVATSSTDDEEKISFFQPDKEESLEYDVSKLIYSVAYPEKKMVGLMTDLPVEGAPANPFAPKSETDRGWMIVEFLKQSFEVKTLTTDQEKIGDDIDVLMIVHPKNLSDKTLFAIDQFVLRGGRAIAFVDPFSEVDHPVTDPNNPMAAMQAPRDSNLTKLFDKWGVEMVPNKVVADIQAATRVSVGRGSRPQSVDYVAWLSLKEENLNQSDFVTSDLKNLNVATAGYFKKKENAQTDIVPLIESSEKSMEVNSSQFQFGPNPVSLLQNYRQGKDKLMLAARISGKVKTAFPDGKPKSTDDEAKDAGQKNEYLQESKEDVNIIVVADTDMLTDKFWVDVQNFFGQSIMIPRANNGVFLVNAIDNLSGSNDLISLRSRGKSNRPFSKVKEIQREAEKRFRDKEKKLQAKLRETEQKINSLQKEKQGQSALILSSEQKQEIEKFRGEQVKTRKELRSVQHELRKNIETLGSWLKFLNIALIPILLIIGAVSFEVYRLKKVKA